MSTKYGKIMVTLDGSGFANKALPHAEKMAAAFGAELLLFRVVNDMGGILEHPAMSPFKMGHRIEAGSGAERAEENPLEGAERELERLADHLRLHDIATEWVVDAGSPAEKIIDYIRNNEIDLLVMSTHSRSGVSRAIHGSVAQEILGSVKCHLLLIQPSD